MKNLYLFLFLIALLTGVYFTQEKRGVEKASSEEEYSRLLDTSEYGDLLEIQTPYNHIKKEGAHFRNFTDGHDVDLKKVNDFLNRVSFVRAVKYIPNEEIKNLADFFPEKHQKITFRFEKGVLEYRLGKKLDYSQEFYVQLVSKEKNVVAISKDSLPFEGVIAKEGAHKSDHKYRRVRALFYLPPNFFMKMNLFSKIIKDEKFNFSNNRNKKFSVDFKSFLTIPSPYKGITVSEPKVRFLKKSLEELRAQRFISQFDKNKLGKMVGSLETGKGVYKIHESYNSDKFYYVITPKENGLYQLKPKEQRVFLFNVQDLWDLRPVHNFDQGIELLINGSEVLSLDIRNLGDEASYLLEFLQSPARYIRDDFEPHDFQKRALELKLGGRELELFFLKKEVILLDRKQKISYHYNRPLKGSISLDPRDYRALK